MINQSPDKFPNIPIWHLWSFTSIILLFLIFQTNTIFSQSLDSNNLSALVHEALQNNPQLKSARSQTLAEQTKVKQVTAWDPPQVGVSFYQTPIQSFPNPIKNGMETDYYIQQMFPFPGKLSNMGKSNE